MIRSFIAIELIGDRIVRYVRDSSRKWRSGDSDENITNASSYLWNNGDTVGGDSWGLQGDSAGRVYFDYETISTNAENGDTWLIFPESGGSTIILKRRNWDVAGDTEGDLCFVQTMVRVNSISDIYVIDQKEPTTTVI